MFLYLLARIIQIQHQSQMSSDQKITFLSEFVICQSQECHQPISIYHKDYFKDNHFDKIEKDKNVPHKSIPFDQSIQYLNFANINRLYCIISKKMEETLRGLPTDIDTVVQTALFKSDIFRQLFSHSDQAISEYFYLNQLSRGFTVLKAYCLSSDFCNAISMPNQKIVNKVYKQLCAYSPQWNFLNQEFNYASGINSSHLQAFLDQEIKYFAEYCNKITEEKKEFNIRQYIAIRSNSKDYVNDPYYYSPEFITFLVQKYEKNPGEQEIFNLMEYYLHFWQYFFVVIENSKNVYKYFDEEVSFYKQYEQFMIEAKLKESFLSYRMWRINRKVSNYLPSLKNPFFLETFIYSFIQSIIEKKLFAPETKINYNFREFAKYLHDYIIFLNEKKEQFNFVRYSAYSDFRRIGEKLEQSLKKNKDIVYDKKFFMEYAHNEFYQGNKLAVKRYRKYQEKRRQEEDEKARIFRQKSMNLKDQLIQEEKQFFYEILYNSFINQIQQQNSSLSLTKESYKQYKQGVLETVDQSYIQEKEAEYKHSLLELTEDKEEEVETEAKPEGIVKEEINAEEEELAEIINDQENSEASSSEEEREISENCPCCKGKPYECQEPECKVLGCCSACMLGD